MEAMSSSTPMFPNRGRSIIALPTSYCLLDLETTGLSPVWDDIIEIGAIKILDGKEAGRFQSLIQPPPLADGDFILPFITDLTGITNEMLRDAPKIDAVLPSLLDFLGDLPIVGYNVSFDVNFIYANTWNLLERHFRSDFVDVMRLARKLHPELPHHRLKDMVDLFGLSHENAHRTLSDCDATQACYLALKQEALEKYQTEEGLVRQFRSRSQPVKAADIQADPSKANADSPIYGQHCVITGKLEQYTRKEAMQIIADLGGINDDTVTKKTNFLVLGNNDYCKTIRDGKSSKQKKAEKYKLEGQDISIVPEDVFYRMLEDNGWEGNSSANEEDAVYTQMLPHIKKAAEEMQLDQSLFRLDALSNYSSVYFGQILLFRLRCRGKKSYLAIPQNLAEIIPETLPSYRIKSDDMIRIEIDPENVDPDIFSIIPPVVENIIQNIPKTFDCCDQYEACSDARRCVLKDQSYAMQCGYRRIMKSGKIYFGKNRNV